MAERRRLARKGRRKSVRVERAVETAPGQITVTTAEEEAKTEDEVKKGRVDEILEAARRRFRLISEAESKLRENQYNDLEFRASEQWDSISKTERVNDKRPCLTINRLPMFIRQVTNSQRQANMAVKVNPVDDKGDIKTAQVLQGIIRNIEARSDASTAYATAGEQQATVGRGYWVIESEYTDDDSFTQELKIRRIRNQFTIYLDPSASIPDGEDAMFGFEIEDILEDEFTERFPEADHGSLNDFMSQGDMFAQDWGGTGNKIRIAHYWWVETERVVKVAIVWPDDVEEVITADELKDFPDDIRIVLREKGRRVVTTRTIKHALINAVQILEGNEDLTDGAVWPGKRIPIFRVLGDEIDINGVVDYRGMVRDAIDPQRLYNFQNTALAEVLSLAPLSQWVGVLGQFDGLETKWEQANRRRFPYLEVNPVSVDGRPAPLPSRITSEPPIQAIVMAIQRADEDMKGTMGLYEPSLGMRGPQQSGKAITALQKQGELANSNFLDNMSRAIRATGREFVNLIPKFYDTLQVVRITGEDESVKTVMVHAGAAEAEGMEKPSGVEGIYDLGAGRYDVTITVGPSMPTKRIEAAAALNELITAYPAAFPIIGDLLIKNMDWPGAQVAAARLKKAVPPQFMDEEEGGQPMVPPEAQQQMQAMAQQIEQMGAALQQAQQLIQGKMLELKAKAAIEHEHDQTKLQIAALQAEADRLEILLKAQMDRGKLMLEQAHERGMAAEQSQQAADDFVRGRVFDRVDKDRDRAEDRVDKRSDRAASRKETREGRVHEFVRAKQDAELRPNGGGA